MRTPSRFIIATLAASIVLSSCTMMHSTPPPTAESSIPKGPPRKVIVEITVGETGEVIGAKLDKSCGDDQTDAAALNAARRLKFPAAKKGTGKRKLKKAITFETES